MDTLSLAIFSTYFVTCCLQNCEGPVFSLLAQLMLSTHHTRNCQGQAVEGSMEVKGEMWLLQRFVLMSMQRTNTASSVEII